ncbi:YceI family protein [Stappia sp. ES.058]|uniref:YceI family protein n=1 Tax=Stappia sp. ES.058 TaxID=1881061 RepID=UPI00087C9EEB|nr:YceI family protein [Stappia sp. ES.058]SDU00254.1 Polyisoprenoid-binding protein YceI [Stappia sp. ES.058]
MRRLTLTALSGLVALGVSFASPAAAEPRDFKIDPAHFSIVFNAEHIGYAPTWGMFLKGKGSFTFDEDTRALSDLSVTIPAGSVFSNHERRDEHLRSDDFLSAETHPDITFVMTSNAEETPRSGTVTGDLTIRGVTRPVTLDVTLNKVGPYPFGDTFVVGISARTTLKRSEFGMTYAVENGLVGDEVPIRIDLEAIRQ